MVREVKETDLNQLLELYLYLHDKAIPEPSAYLKDTWNSIINDDKYHIIVKEFEGKIVASCTCLIVPNLTRGVRPYAFVENVVTHEDYRERGYARECLNYAKELAVRENCYKMMLITGSSQEKTHRFYKNSGYFSEGKTAYYQMLDWDV